MVRSKSSRSAWVWGNALAAAPLKQKRRHLSSLEQVSRNIAGEGRKLGIVGIFHGIPVLAAIGAHGAVARLHYLGQVLNLIERPLVDGAGCHEVRPRTGIGLYIPALESLGHLLAVVSQKCRQIPPQLPLVKHGPSVLPLISRAQS